MSIGHASIDENRKTKGGKAGDQTGKEVCTTSWYAKGWDYILRAKDKNIAERMALACEAGCNNNNLGYSQDRRNSLRTQAKLVGMDLSKITTPCDCDCSSFMSVCAECAGVPIPYSGGNAPTTSTMKTVFLNTGYFDLYTDEKYLTSDKYLKRGDIIVAIGSHTVMVLSDGALADISQKANQQFPIKAIDLSQYNIITDYKIMANQIQYVGIRVGYRGGTTGAIVEDKLFKTHIENCLASGIKNIFCYFYDQSINEVEANEQADWVLEKIKPYNVTLPIYIDSEAMPNHTGRADNISKDQRTKNVLAFCNRIQDKGRISGVYASDSWFKTMLNFDQIKNYSIWCARYSAQKPTVAKYDIWQYGSEQFIWGQKPIDVNWIYNLSIDGQKPQNVANTSEIKGNNKITSYNYEICNKVKVSDFLNIRIQPIINAPIIGKLYNNDKVDICGYVKDWYMISPKMDKWVNSKYVVTKTGKTTANLNYREGASTNNAVLGMYEKGTIVKLLSKKSCQDGYWYLCVDDKDRFGWCSGKYISM